MSDFEDEIKSGAPEDANISVSQNTEEPEKIIEENSIGAEVESNASSVEVLGDVQTSDNDCDVPPLSTEEDKPEEESDTLENQGIQAEIGSTEDDGDLVDPEPDETKDDVSESPKTEKKNLYQIDIDDPKDKDADEDDEHMTAGEIIGAIAIIVCVAIIGAALGYSIVHFIYTSAANKATEEVSAIYDEYIEEQAAKEAAELSIADVAELVMPSIVSISSDYMDVIDISGRSYYSESQQTGTGFIVSYDTEEGYLYIVTNNHVIEDGKNITVQFVDESEAEAIVKGSDESLDIAVLAVDTSNIDADTLSSISIASIGDSDSLRIGDEVLAFGNALGYGQSVTSGIVSALNRTISSDEISGEFIQTDAAINVGNSGGPLVDMDGNVVGITSSKVSGSSVEGMGYAIPISDVIDVIDSLIEGEMRFEVEDEDKGYLGIRGITVEDDVSAIYGIPNGAYVYSIIYGSGAYASDLEAGDIIIALNDIVITGIEQLQEELAYYEAGETVIVSVMRKDETGEYVQVDVEVTLGNESSLEGIDVDITVYGEDDKNTDDDSEVSITFGDIETETDEETDDTDESEATVTFDIIINEDGSVTLGE